MWRAILPYISTACVLPALVLSFASLGSTEEKRGRWDGLIARNLRSLGSFDSLRLREDGAALAFPFVTIDEVWDSVVRVLVQRGIIVYSSKQERVLVAITPEDNLGVFVEPREARKVSVLVIDRNGENIDELPAKAVAALEGGASFEDVVKMYGREDSAIEPSGRDGYCIPEDVRRRSRVLSETAFALRRGGVASANQLDRGERFVVRVEDIRDVIAVYVGTLSGPMYHSVNRLFSSESLFDAVATQLYAKHRWQYLREPSRP